MSIGISQRWDEFCQKWHFSAILIIIICGLFFYANSFSNDFVWDDEVLIAGNELIKDIGNWNKIITQELQDGSQTNYYRPLQVFSYALDYSIYKLRPFGYHLSNFLLHIMNAILVFSLIRILVSNFQASVSNPQFPIRNLQFVPLFTALLFVVHPVHTESVSYIAGRADLLVGFFILSALILYIRQFHTEKYKRVLNLTSIFLFCLALFSKEMSVIFPAGLIIYEYFFRKEDKGKFRRIGPFLFIACFYITLRLSILDFSSGYFWSKLDIHSYNAIRFFSFFKGIVLYLGLLVMPVNLYMERFISPAKSIFDPYVLFFILLLSVAVLIFKRFRVENRQLIVFAVFWFIVFLFSQSNFFFIRLVAEHFLYLPSIGMFLAAACGINSLYLRKKIFARVIFISIIVFLGALTFAQNSVWRNSLTFYHWTDKMSSSSYMARTNLANVYFYLGLEDLAIKKYEQAAGINPKLAIVGENLGFIEDYLIEEYKHLLKSGANHSIVYYNLAYVYERKGRLDEALLFYKKAIEINPDFVRAISNLGNVYEKTGKSEQALAKYKQAVSINPRFAQGYFNIAAVLGNQGKLKQARAYFEQALKIDPDYQKAKENIKKIDQMLLK